MFPTNAFGARRPAQAGLPSRMRKSCPGSWTRKESLRREEGRTVSWLVGLIWGFLFDDLFFYCGKYVQHKIYHSNHPQVYSTVVPSRTTTAVYPHTEAL